MYQGIASRLVVRTLSFVGTQTSSITITIKRKKAGLSLSNNASQPLQKQYQTKCFMRTVYKVMKQLFNYAYRDLGNRRIP